MAPFPDEFHRKTVEVDEELEEPKPATMEARYGNPPESDN
jgi:hypothetical protein